MTPSAGRADLAVLEARGDVVTFTTAPLREPLTVAGRAVLLAAPTGSTGRTDLAVRLAEVDPAGRSVSVSDGYGRVPIADGAHQIAVATHPVAHRFARGSRVRLVVAGGSFPQHDRNLGVDGDPLTATAMRPTRVHLGAGARLTLPVLAG